MVYLLRIKVMKNVNIFKEVQMDILVYKNSTSVECYKKGA